MKSDVPTSHSGVQVSLYSDSSVLGTAANFQKFSSQFGWPILFIFALAPRIEWQSTFVAVVSSFPAVFMGIFIRLWARGYQHSEAFELDGPYRYVRNPVELGALMTYAGMGGLLGLHSLYLLISILLAAVYLSTMGLVHDRKLFAERGGSFLRYCQRISRWYPSRVPGINRSDRNFSLPTALYNESESLLWLFGYFVVVGLRNHFKI